MAYDIQPGGRKTKPRKPVTKPKSPRKAATRAKPSASDARPPKLLTGGNPQIAPVPPGGMGKDARWIDIHEDGLDEAQMADWVKQAAALPGGVP